MLLTGITGSSQETSTVNRLIFKLEARHPCLCFPPRDGKALFPPTMMVQHNRRLGTEPGKKALASGNVKKSRPLKT